MVIDRNTRVAMGRAILNRTIADITDGDGATSARALGLLNDAHDVLFKYSEGFFGGMVAADRLRVLIYTPPQAGMDATWAAHHAIRAITYIVEV